MIYLSVKHLFMEFALTVIIRELAIQVVTHFVSGHEGIFVAGGADSFALLL